MHWYLNRNYDFFFYKLVKIGEKDYEKKLGFYIFIIYFYFYNII